MKSFLLTASICFTVLSAGLKGCADSRAPEKGTDPKDYYGIYYFLNDYLSYQFEIKDTGECTIVTKDGRSTTQEYRIYDVEYVSNEYANYLLKTSNSHTGFDALMVYNGGYQDLSLENVGEAIVLWAQKTGDSYSLQMNVNGAKSRTSEPTAAEITGSANIVLGSTYTFNSINYLSFNSSNKVDWVQNGERINMSYLCVSMGWASKYYKSVPSQYSNFVLVYDEFEQHQYLFGISGNTIVNGDNVYSK